MSGGQGRGQPGPHGFQFVNGSAATVGLNAADRPDSPMLIVCPTCATSYDVELASLQPNGRQVRCVRCRAIWHAAPSHADKLLAAAEAIGPEPQAVHAPADDFAEEPAMQSTDEQVAEAFEMSRYTVILIRERFVSNGLDDALNHRHHTQTRARALDGEQEAHQIALSCSPSPVGQARWTLRLLAGRMVELGYVEQISYETVRQALKKTNSNRG